MTLQPPTEESSFPLARMAVWVGAKSSQVTTVSLVGQEDGTIQLSVSGDDPERSIVFEAAKEAAANMPLTGQPLGERLTEQQKAICNRLLSDGFQVEELPAEDIAFKFELDLKSGRALGNFTKLHEFATADKSLARNIHTAITEVFKKLSLELAEKIEQCIGVKDHVGAAKEVKVGLDEGKFIGELPGALLDAMQKIQVEQLDAESRLLVCETRIAVAARLGLHEVGESSARTMLNDHALTDRRKRSQFENIIAIASVKRGETETALSIWRKLTKELDSLDPGERAWIWRNISMALHGGDEAIRAARLSIDAFLEAGDKVEGAASLMRLSHLLEAESPVIALQEMNKMLELINERGMIGSEMRASFHHSRGKRLLEMRQFPSALADAQMAVKMRRGVLGAEQELISSLHLAGMAARNTGDSAMADRYDAEAKEQEGMTSSTYFAIARRIGELSIKFDKETAEQILSDAHALGNTNLIVGAEVMAATQNPDLDVTARLGKLERVLRDLERNRTQEDVIYPVLLAIASVLRGDGEFARAEPWLERILKDRPLDISARNMLIDCFWQTKDWGSAAIFLKGQIHLFGEMPGLIYAYGRSLLEAGDVSGAIPVLSRGIKLTNPEDELHQLMNTLRERALDLGGTIIPPSVERETHQFVLRDELVQALQEFAHFVSADKRMGFWNPPVAKGDYTWISEPEQRAQDLLHTFLKARFQARISLYEELDTGAGRLDLLLKLEGGLSVIVELKMCGFGYSSSYAASGEGQIRHYMQTRSSHLGYLVVHDSRLENFGSPLIEQSNEGGNTISEIFVDIRPRVSSRKMQKRAKPIADAG